MVSVRLVHAIANKKGALIVVIDTSQTINKQMFVIDAITESLVSHILMFATIADHDQALVFWLCEGMQTHLPAILFHIRVKKLPKTEEKSYNVCRLRTQATNRRNAEFIYDTVISLAHGDDSTWLSFCVVTFAPTKPL